MTENLKTGLFHFSTRSKLLLHKKRLWNRQFCELVSVYCCLVLTGNFGHIRPVLLLIGIDVNRE